MTVEVASLLCFRAVVASNTHLLPTTTDRYYNDYHHFLLLLQLRLDCFYNYDCHHHLLLPPAHCDSDSERLPRMVVVLLIH